MVKENQELLAVRLDKWLWAARFFKTRGLAREAIDGGKVKHNGAKAKPSKAVKLADELEIQRGDDIWHIKVEGVTERRGPAKDAVLLYEEFEQSRLAREVAAEQRKLQRSEAPQRRPDKKQRRLIRDFKGREIG